MHGLQRAFVGDRVADDLAIPDTRWRTLPRITGPVTAFGYAAFDRMIPDGRAWRTRYGFRLRAREFARIRADYGVAHELVDDVWRRV